MHRLQHISDLGLLLEKKEIRHVVLAPGSRNAPLTQLFTARSSFICHSIVDERSAGYVAMGMAKHLRKPVAVVTTSGTAVLNLGPSVAEAFHQQIPLIVLTADRPLERIRQFNNQVIDQKAPFRNYSKGFLQLPFAVGAEPALRNLMVSVGKLIDSSIGTSPGPIHLNIPLLEPLYEDLPNARLEDDFSINSVVSVEDMPIPDIELSGKRVMVLAGMGSYGEEILAMLNELSASHELVVIAENTGNLPSDLFVAHPEILLAAASESERKYLAPEILLSFGGQIVSKRLRLFLDSLHDLRAYEILENVPAQLRQIFGEWKKDGAKQKNDYLAYWKELETRELDRARHFLEKAPFGNLTAIYQILLSVPSGSVVHLGNSATIRNSQLITIRSDLRYFANRGTSGIDGSVSTAVGAAMVSGDLHVLLVGDLSFVYDSNALWNKQFPSNLKIVVINDGGGGIFRLLEGPDRMAFFEEYSITHHPVSLEWLSRAFGRGFKRIHSMKDLKGITDSLFQVNSSLSVLEVDTTKSENSRIFKDFFNIN